MLARRLPFWLNDPQFAPDSSVPEGEPAALARLRNMHGHVLQQEPPPVASASAPVNRVLRRALSKSPAARFPDCRTFIRALAKAHQRERSPASPSLVTVGVVALLVAAGGWAAYRHRTGQPLLPGWTRPPVPAAARGSVEEEARRRAEAERLAAQRAQTRQDAEALRQGCERRLAELAAEPQAGALLAAAQAKIKAAQATDPALDPAAALTAWQAVRDALADVEAGVSRLLRAECEQLTAEVEAQRQRAKHWENWDPAIGEKLVAGDVTYALAREQRQQENFAAARKLYRDSLATLKATEALARGTYQPTLGKDFTVGRVGMEMVWLAPLKLWVGKYEVTNRQFRQFQPAHTSKKHADLSLDGDDQPVCWIRYYDAVAFCAWLNQSVPLPDFLPAGCEYRLPTKAEWQAYATGGRPQAVFPWGDDWPPPYGNFADRQLFPSEWKLDGYEDEYPVTCRVQDSGRNAWGLYGVAGNVWEWTSEVKDGKRAVFGGSWSTGDKRQLQVDLGDKNFADPQLEYDNIGFRVLLGPKAALAAPGGK